MKNLLKQKFTLRGPQCLSISKITNLLKSFTCWFDPTKLNPLCEKQRILRQMRKTHTPQAQRKITLESISVIDVPFLRTTPCFISPSFFMAKLNFSISKIQPASFINKGLNYDLVKYQILHDFQINYLFAIFHVKSIFIDLIFFNLP